MQQHATPKPALSAEVYGAQNARMLDHCIDQYTAMLALIANGHTVINWQMKQQRPHIEIIPGKIFPRFECRDSLQQRHRVKVEYRLGFRMISKRGMITRQA